MTFKQYFEEKAKLKLAPTMSNYDAYKSVRKPTVGKGVAFKDKSKYNRKDKFKKSHDND